MKKIDRKGFSLVEVVIALGLFAIVLSTSYSALTQGLVLSKNAKLESNASVYICNEMEYLRSLGWDQIEALQNKAPFSTLSPDSALTGQYQKADRKTDQVIIKLAVTWKDANQRTQTADTVCILTKDGLGSL